MKVLVDLRKKSNSQLERRLVEISLGLRRCRSTGYSENTMLIGKLRKERARILTILNERKQRKKKK